MKRRAVPGLRQAEGVAEEIAHHDPYWPAQLTVVAAILLSLKTDVLDAQWIQRLHSHGLLQGSFRPPDSVLALRAYWRQRQMQVRYAACHVQHM